MQWVRDHTRISHPHHPKLNLTNLPSTLPPNTILTLNPNPERGGIFLCPYFYNGDYLYLSFFLLLNYLYYFEILGSNLFKYQAAEDYFNAQLSEAMSKLPEYANMPLEVEPPPKSSLQSIIITRIYTYLKSEHMDFQMRMPS